MKIITDTYKGSVRYIVAQTEGVCSQAIELLVEGDVILDAAFHGGCNGNLKGIVALVKGQKISDVKERLYGITCGGKSTSCPDQFAQLLRAIQKMRTTSGLICMPALRLRHARKASWRLQSFSRRLLQ